MKIFYPRCNSDWKTTTYGASHNDGIRFPNCSIFYSNRSDGSMRFAYVRNGKLYDSQGEGGNTNGMSIIVSLVDLNKRGRAWTCGQLKVILPDTKEHVDADYYRTNFSIEEST